MREELYFSKPEDFSEVYKQFYDKVMRYIVRKINSHEDAEDLVSDVFEYCFKHYSEYSPEKSAISTWIYLVTNSRIKNYYRDKKQIVPLSEVETFLADDGQDMESCAILEQTCNQVRAAIDQLPDRQRQAVIMKFFKNSSSEEIAVQLGTTPGNARVILNRALKQLEKQCAELMKGKN